MQWMPLDATHSDWKVRLLLVANELLLKVERQRTWMLVERIRNWRASDHLDEAARRLTNNVATLRLFDARASLAVALADGRRRGSTRSATPSSGCGGKVRAKALGAAAGDSAAARAQDPRHNAAKGRPILLQLDVLL